MAPRGQTTYHSHWVMGDSAGSGPRGNSRRADTGTARSANPGWTWRLPARSGVVPAGTLLLLMVGLALRLTPRPFWSGIVLEGSLLLTGLPIVVRALRGILRGQFAADLVASLAIGTALALHQPVPGLVVVIMQTGGEALERYAAGRASRAVADLEAASPRLAHRLQPDTTVADVGVEQVQPGDLLLVRPGEMLPTDARVRSGQSSVDVSRLTGEPFPLVAEPGRLLLSGSLNLDSPLTVEATAPAAESQYARIVELVRRAQASRSPLQRMAERYAIYFTPATLLVCLVAWLASQDPTRVLAVLVVATPCPLILAAPVALIGGLSHGARHGVIIRHGDALERLGEVRVAALDKTGTLTVGQPRVSELRVLPPFDTQAVLGAAAAVEHGSGHPLARTVVAHAQAQGLQLGEALNIREAPGQGVTGEVGGRRVALGGRGYITGLYPDTTTVFDRVDRDGALRAYIVIDGRAAGVITFADQLHAEARTLLARLSELGITRVMLLTGDDEATARRVASSLGITEVHANLLPQDKAALVDRLERAGDRVIMVGDGTNDAPALARATVGVALAAGGGGISAESADVVVLADEPSQVAEAIGISRRTLRIARQSVWAGLGLSLVAMVVAAAGFLPPISGAVLQEVIDVAVIVNALRASRD